MKVALVYDRVNKWGGAESVLLVLNEMFPRAPLYTAVYSPEKAKWAKVFPKVIPTFLNKIPYLNQKHELLGAFTPIAFESLDLTGYDLAISVTSEAAKGIITNPKTKHICYCLTPTRYLWSHYDTYFKGRAFKTITKPVVGYLRHWDKIAAHRVDHFIAISSEIKKRIKKYYDRDSEIIFPPVELEKFSIKDSNFKKEDYYLVVSRLVPYKKVDLVIEAFNQLGHKLVVIGTGSEELKLKRMSKDNITLTGYLTYKEIARYYQKARGFIFPQEEDFGLTPVESQAAGTAVIAYKKGGSADTVVKGVTGVFFDKQKQESLIKAVKEFENLEFDTEELVNNSKRFSKEAFIKKLKKFIYSVI